MSLLNFRKRRSATDEFGELLEEHLDSMFRVALRYTRQQSTAEDLVHDTVVRALRFRDRFEMGTNFKAWVLTILTHTFIHRYRRQKREREILDGTTRDDVAQNLRSDESHRRMETPEHAYFRDLLSDDVVHALDALPEDFRRVVVLCDVEGLSYKEISDVEGCPVGTVMSRLYRGRRMMEERLMRLAIEQGIVRPVDKEEDGGVLDLKSYRRRRAG